MFSYQDYFYQKKPKFKALQAYGFQKEEKGYVYSTSLLDHLVLQVLVSSLGSVHIEVMDAETKEPYTLYQTNASGEYVGRVREALETILQDIANRCFVSNVFQERQSLAVIHYVKDHYQTSLEFLWEKFPDIAIWRHASNNKWFGLITHLPLSKLGIDSKEEADILVLHLPKSVSEQDIQSKEKDIFPAWHMNKTHWYSMVLNDWLEDKAVFERLDESFKSTQN